VSVSVCLSLFLSFQIYTEEVSTQQENGCFYMPQREPSPETKNNQSLDLDFLGSKTVRKQISVVLTM
jgi:hypothetical protein